MAANVQMAQNALEMDAFINKLARVLLLSILGCAIYVRRFSTDQTDRFLLSIPYRCPLRLLTGWKCAFCGMTHSWIAIFRGDFLTSFHENIFGIPLFLITLGVLLIYAFNRKITMNLKPVFVGSLVVLTAYAVLRNIL